LPNSFGIHTLTRICTKAAQVPVIVLSGLDDVTMIEKAKKAGAYDYLLKENLDHESLVQAIRQAIEHKKSV
jgi:glutamate dehydrogenase (NAD(P)+)